MVFAASLFVVGCKKNDDQIEPPITPPSLTLVTFTPEAPSIEVGKTTAVTIVGTLSPTDKIQIADEEIVALQGEITNNKINLLAKKIGATKVGILSAEGKERGSFKITVTPVFELHFTLEAPSIEVGKTTVVTIVGTLNPTDKVQIADEEIAALQGEITNNKINLLAKKIGATKVSILSGEGKERGSFEITVTPVFELHFTPEVPSIEVGKTTVVTIVGTLNPTDKVQIADEEIVAQQGEITNNKINLFAKKIGTTKVSILSAEGKKRGSFEITVTPIFQLSFTPEKLTIEQQKTAQVTIVGTLNPTDKIQIADEEIVAQQGEIINNKINLFAKKTGTTKVSILSAEGKERGSFEITVTPVFQLSFTPEKLTIEQQKTAQVTIVGTLNPTDKVQIADEEIVAQQGKVTNNKINLLAKKIGATKVSILSAEGKERGSFEITVTPIFQLSFTPEKLTIEQQKTAQVTIVGTLNPTDKVQIANEEIVALQGKVTNNKINLLAKKIGTTKVSILSAEGKERGSFEITVTPKLLLSFSPAKVVIKKGETATITVTGVWNASDKIRIVNETVVSLQGEATNNKINLLALKVGSTQVHVLTADGRDRGSFEVVVYEDLKKMTLSHKSDIPHYKTEISSKEEYKRLIEQTLRTHELLKRELEQLEKYPLEKYRYNDQNALYLEGIRISRAAKLYYKENKETADLKNLKNTYENLHQYGIGYTEVEIMVRLAELYRQEFPHNTEIERIIKDNFNGEYGNLDGPILTNYLNKNIVKAFNDIIDIVNKLK